MLRRIFCLTMLLLLMSCVSSLASPTALPPPTLPVATGIPVTPRPNATRPPAPPTPTVETLPTPENVRELFAEATDLLTSYQPPESDPKPLYDALAAGSGEFLAATANGDVSLEGQPALMQLEDALSEILDLPDRPDVHAAAIHTGEDQGGSRDLVFVAVNGLMGMPIIGLERLGATYEPLAPIASGGIESPEARYFYPIQLESQDVTGDGTRELIYMLEYPGASGTTNELTVARWLEDKKELHTIFHADLINWAGEADYQIETAADASSIKLSFPWFGAFDHKLLLHPNATQSWEYDDALDRFVRVSTNIEEPKTPRQAVNAAEYALRNGELEEALELFERAQNDPELESEDFAESKADPKVFARFRQGMILSLLGRAEEGQAAVAEAQQSGDALAALAKTFAENSSGGEGALRGWIAMAASGELYQLLYDGKAGNLDFPFEASEIYAAGGIVASFLNTHADADKNPEVLWGVLGALGFRPLGRAAADLNGDGVNEFFVVTQEGGTSPNQWQSLWFVYKRDDKWRVRALNIADTVQFEGAAVPLPNGGGHALTLKLPDERTPNRIALTWDGTKIVWLDAATLEAQAEQWTSVGGGVLEDDF